MKPGESWLRAPRAPRRCGVKGPRAAELLQSLGLAVPESANRWAPLRAGDPADSPNVIGRLGTTEFFLEEGGGAPGIAALEKITCAGSPGAYPVLREDFAVVLGGARADEVLAQVCNVNFASLAPHAVVMTLMIGVGVLVMPQQTADGLVYRIWCDPSFGPYLNSELERVVKS